MDFVWLNKQGVQSSDGFVFQGKHRFYYHYTENGRTLKVYVESGRINDVYTEDLYLEPNSKWEPPFEHEELEEQELNRISSNLLAAMKFMNISCRIFRKKHGK